MVLRKQGDLYVPDNLRLGSGPLDRRGFLVESVRYGGIAGGAVALAPMLACDGGLGAGAADGTFEAPWTADDPGNIVVADEAPAVFAAYATESSVRIWVEVINTGTGVVHPQEQDHYISGLYIVDDFGNEIAAQSFAYQNEARLIQTVIIPADVQSVSVYRECNQHGFFRATYSVPDFLNVNPVGDLRRPLTSAKPGDYADKIAVHLPVFGRRPNGDFSVEVGDRAAGKLHEMIPTHYISTILVFDENAQLRVRAGLDPAYNAEPVVDFPPVGGVAKLRVVALCNLHKWWEVVFAAA